MPDRSVEADNSCPHACKPSDSWFHYISVLVYCILLQVLHIFQVIGLVELTMTSFKLNRNVVDSTVPFALISNILNVSALYYFISCTLSLAFVTKIIKLWIYSLSIWKFDVFVKTSLNLSWYFDRKCAWYLRNALYFTALFD